MGLILAEIAGKTYISQLCRTSASELSVMLWMIYATYLSRYRIWSWVPVYHKFYCFEHVIP